MATYYSDLCSLTNVVPAKSELGTNTAIGTITIGTALAAADVIQMVKVPANAIIQDIIISTSASLGTTSTASLGDGSSTARFAAAAAFGQGSATYTRASVAGGHGYQYTAEDTIDITIATMATPVTAAVVKCSVQYIIP